MELTVSEVLSGYPADYTQFLKKLLSARNYIPALTLATALDDLFPDVDWWDFEPETVTALLHREGLFTSDETNSQIQAVAACRGKQSFMDKEWHIFEKAALSMSGYPVLFFEKQHLPIEAADHAISIMAKLGVYEPSDEVKHYIGSSAVDQEVLWYPAKQINDCITFALDMLGNSIAADRKEIELLRSGTATRFAVIKDSPIEDLEFDQEDAVDMMVARVLRSLVLKNSHMSVEMDFLSAYNSIKKGQVAVEGLSKELIEYLTEEHVKVPEVVENTEEFNPNPNSVSDSSMTIVDVPAPDTEFDEYVKEAFIKSLETVSYLVKDAGLSGVPIQTGVYMEGFGYEPESTNEDLVTTTQDEGDAVEIMHKKLFKTEDYSTDPPVKVDDDYSEGADSSDGLDDFQL